jgi:VWFA-related protein
VSLGLPAAPLGAQGIARAQFGEVVDVRVLNLEVVVVDRQGNRVSGLGPGDFRLRLDGDEVPVDYFSEIFEGRVEEGEPAGVPGMVPGRPAGTNYLVFIDEYFTRAQERNRVLQGISEQLSRLGPEDRMALVAFNGRKLDMLSAWSRDPRVLHRAFAMAVQRPAVGPLTEAALRDPVREISDDRASGDRFSEDRASSLGERVEYDGSVDMVIHELQRRLERVSLAVTASLRSFGHPPPGRKVLLLMSGGWPHSPARYAINAQGPLLEYGEQEGTEIFRPVYETANLLGYTVYPIDAPGKRSHGVDAGSSGPRDFDFRESETHMTLDVLASETGGQALLDGARLTAFERVVEDTRSYYWLGVTPKWRGDDKSHKIKVEALRPGLKVRCREGYQDFSREKEVSFMVESALLFGELPGAHPLRVRLGAASKSGRRLSVPIEMAIPMDGIVMVPRKDHYAAELELRIAALDEGGHRNEIAVIPVELAGPKPAPGQHAVYETAVKLRNQAHDLVISLHDPLGGTIFASVKQFVP